MNPNIEIVRGDILDREAVDRAVTGVSGVYHLAGSVTRNPAKAEKLFETHIRGTRNICESALIHGCPKIVLASSSGTIAASRGPLMHNEESAYTFETVGAWPYYLSKIYQEKLALSYYTHHNLPVVVISPSLLLGPGDERLSSTGDIQLFLDGYLANIPQGGLNFADVRDTADAFIAAMDVGVPGRRYLIGSYNMTVKEFFAIIEKVSKVRAPKLQLSERSARGGVWLLCRLYRLLGRGFPLNDVTVQMAYRFWYLDSTRAKSELNFKPRAAEETIRDTVEYLRKHHARCT